MIKKHLVAVAMPFIAIIIAIAGCGSGGGDSGGATPAPPVGSPAIQVSPGTYDFGKVTASNTPAPLEVTVRNGGTAPLRVSTISFGAASDSSFILNLNGGSKPCNTAAPTLAPADSCTFHVRFQPTSSGSVAANVQISSDDRNLPSTGISIAGTSEPVTALSVRINQLETACPTNEATAYVSVTDQGGFAVPGLQASNFSATEGTNPSLTITSSSSVDLVYQSIAIAAVMDYSGSLTDQTVAFADMKNGFSSLFTNLRANDIGEVIKFDNEIEVVQPFTSNKAALLAAIAAPFDKGRATKLYDAVFQAVEDTAVNANYRRAVIVATDGREEGPTPGVPFSTHSLTEVINNAISKKVPIFTIGLGSLIDRSVLQRMATDTGGLFYEANTSQNLANIYQQLSSVLYEKQYILTFDQLVRGMVGSPSNLTIAANFLGLTGSAATTITSCN